MPLGSVGEPHRQDTHVLKPSVTAEPWGWAGEGIEGGSSAGHCGTPIQSAQETLLPVSKLPAAQVSGTETNLRFTQERSTNGRQWQGDTTQVTSQLQGDH